MLLHTAVLLFHRHFLVPQPEYLHLFPVIVGLALLGLALVFRWRQLGLLLGGVALTMSAVQQFPFTANHAAWALVLNVTMLLLCSDQQIDRKLLSRYVFLQAAVIVFWTGVQKVWYGTYFQGEFLIVMARSRESFGAVMRFLLDRNEWESFAYADLHGQDGLVWRSSSPLLLLASNIVWVFELIAPLLLFWKRLRKPVIILIIVFLLGIQLSAIELIFATLAINALAMELSWKHHRALMFVSALVLLGLLAGTGLGFWEGDVWN